MSYEGTLREKQVYTLYLVRNILSGFRWQGLNMRSISSVQELFAGTDSGNPDSPTVEVRGERLQLLLDQEIERLQE